jgi:hypothetical protein
MPLHTTYIANIPLWLHYDYMHIHIILTTTKLNKNFTFRVGLDIKQNQCQRIQ